MKQKEKIEAVELRKQGKSFNEISSLLGVSKGTLSYWFKNMQWSENVKNKLTKIVQKQNTHRLRLMSKANQEKWERWRSGFREEARKEFPKFKTDKLFVAGLMLYWSEGDNKIESPHVRLTNTDPRMIKMFIEFARRFCKVSDEAIRIGLILYPDLKKRECMKFWSEYLDVPEIQFHKIQIIKGRHPTRRLEKGICMVRVGGMGLKQKMKTWIDLYVDNFIRAGIV